MDLAYLHMLQELRQSLPEAVEWFFVALSWLGNGPALVALVLVVYWCLDKREGQRALTALALGVYANQLIKNIACVYRPWIRDSTIIPAPLAVPGAGGYSFPSGHTSGTASALGSLGWQERKRRRWVVVAGVAVTLLMMFSRNFLGVHTPQDVVVGLAVAVLAVVASQRLHTWIEGHEAEIEGDTQAGRRDRTVLVAAVAIAVVSMVYVALKAYPLDYVDGTLLVDPDEMRKGCFESAGLWLGWACGWALERRLVGFSTEGIDRRTRIVRFAVGVGIVGITYLLAGPLSKAILPYSLAKLVQMGSVALVATFAAPAAFTKLERRRAILE